MEAAGVSLLPSSRCHPGIEQAPPAFFCGRKKANKQRCVCVSEWVWACAWKREGGWQTWIQDFLLPSGCAKEWKVCIEVRSPNPAGAALCSGKEEWGLGGGGARVGDWACKTGRKQGDKREQEREGGSRPLLSPPPSSRWAEKFLISTCSSFPPSKNASLSFVCP